MTEGLDETDALVQLSFAVQEVLAAIAADYDVSITQVRMLGVLRDCEPAMLELAGYLGLEKSSATGLVDRAERRGFVERFRDAGDARTVHLRMTAEGKTVAAAFADRVRDELADLLEPLPAADRKRLTSIAGRIVGTRVEAIAAGAAS